MEDAMDTNQSDVRALFDRRSEAFWLKDIDRLMALYAPEVVYFDLVPPLRYSGSAALRSRFAHWFEGWKSPIGMEIEDLTILANDDLAAAHMLLRASGTLQDGRDVGYWVRTTNTCRRAAGSWSITHEHVSLPVDIQSRSAVMDLTP
jgi:ketosteroid isomerase-like protein